MAKIWIWVNLGGEDLGGFRPHARQSPAWERPCSAHALHFSRIALPPKHCQPHVHQAEEQEALVRLLDRSYTLHSALNHRSYTLHYTLNHRSYTLHPTLNHRSYTLLSTINHRIYTLYFTLNHRSYTLHSTIDPTLYCLYSTLNHSSLTLHTSCISPRSPCQPNPVRHTPTNHHAHQPTLSHIKCS